MPHLDATQSSAVTSPSQGVGAALGVVAVALLLAVMMVASAYHLGPSGQRLGFWAFITFWMREILLLGFLLGGTVIWAGAKIQRSSRSNGVSEDAP